MCAGIFILKCICNSAYLCALEAYKKISRSRENMVRNIFNFLHSNAKRQSTSKQFQLFMDLKPKTILHSFQTRWLFLEAVVNKLLEQWEALKLYFNYTYLDQHFILTEQMYNSYNDKLIQIIITF